MITFALTSSQVFLSFFFFVKFNLNVVILNFLNLNEALLKPLGVTNQISTLRVTLIRDFMWLCLEFNG